MFSVIMLVGILVWLVWEEIQYRLYQKPPRMRGETFIIILIAGTLGLLLLNDASITGGMVLDLATTGSVALGVVVLLFIALFTFVAFRGVLSRLKR